MNPMLREPHTRAMRLVASTLIAAFVSTALPSAAAEPVPAPSTVLASAASAASLSRPCRVVASAEPLDCRSLHSWLLGGRTASPRCPQGARNRQPPKVSPVPLQPVFSAVPTDDEILRARIFEEPLVPVGETTPEENRALADAIDAYVAAGDKLDLTPFEGLLARRRRDALARLASARPGHRLRARRSLHTGDACWEEAWALTKDLEEAFPRRGRRPRARRARQPPHALRAGDRDGEAAARGRRATLRGSAPTAWATRASGWRCAASTRSSSTRRAPSPCSGSSRTAPPKPSPIRGSTPSVRPSTARP